MGASGPRPAVLPARFYFDIFIFVRVLDTTWEAFFSRTMGASGPRPGVRCAISYFDICIFVRV